MSRPSEHRVRIVAYVTKKTARVWSHLAKVKSFGRVIDEIFFPEPHGQTVKFRKSEPPATEAAVLPMVNYWDMPRSEQIKLEKEMGFEPAKPKIGRGRVKIENPLAF